MESLHSGRGQLKRGSTGVSEVEGRGRGAAKKGFNLDGAGGRREAGTTKGQNYNILFCTSLHTSQWGENVDPVGWDLNQLTCLCVLIYLFDKHKTDL